MNIINLISKLLDSRRGTALWYMIGVFVFCFAFGGLLVGTIFYFMQGGLNYFAVVTRMTNIFLKWFGAPFIIAALFILFTNIDMDWCTKFGYIFYYGTAIISSTIGKILKGNRSFILIISLIITTFISYFSYKEFKDKF